MAKFDYNKMVDLADKLLSDFGGQDKVTITFPTSETFNVATQTNVILTDTFDVWAVGAPFDQSEIDGQTILQSDIRLTMQASQGTPTIADKATWQGVDYRIMDVRPVSPGGTNIVYVCQLRI